MKPAISCCLLSVLAVLAAACGGSARYPTSPDLSIRVSTETPPSPATWPPYPRFSRGSCWARPFLKGDVPTVLQVAPSYPISRRRPVPRGTVAHRLLVRFGDQRYIRAIRFGHAPPAVGKRVHVLYAGGHPPRAALVATIVTAHGEPVEVNAPSPGQSLTNSIVTWEANLIGGALRDDLCAAAGAPLISWSGAGIIGMSERNLALEQRFPNPSPSAFRSRVALVGRRFGFRIVSLRLLRPRQMAPCSLWEPVVGGGRSRTTYRESWIF
jgi:hypothetical protein